MNKDKENIELLNKLKSKKYTDEELYTLSTYCTSKDEVYILTPQEREAIEYLIKEINELKIDLTWRINYCGLLERELYGYGKDYKAELTISEKRILKGGE